MTAVNRTDVLKRLYAELKKKYTVTAPVERTVLEYFIFATCLEDATYEAAENAFAALVHTMSGWNEVRVSSVAELAEMMPQLPDPRGTAVKIRRILHSIFEERYSFNIDDIRKKNIKEAYEKLESIPGGTPFSINYTAQVAFGRHGIPVGIGEKRLLYVLGIIDEAEIESREVAGLNRAISKTQEIEFSSLLHQLAAAFVQNPEARKILTFLKAFSPDFRDRMPKRREVRTEISLETPEPVVSHEVPHKTVMEMIINDPDFRKERKEDLYEEDFAEPKEDTEDFVEEPSPRRKKQKTYGNEFSSSDVKTAPEKTDENGSAPSKTVSVKSDGTTKAGKAEKIAAKPVEKPVEKVVEKPIEKSAPEKAAERPAKKAAEKTAKTVAQKSSKTSEPPSAKEPEKDSGKKLADKNEDSSTTSKMKKKSENHTKSDKPTKKSKK